MSVNYVQIYEIEEFEFESTKHGGLFAQTNNNGANAVMGVYHQFLQCLFSCLCLIRGMQTWYMGDNTANGRPSCHRRVAPIVDT